MNQFILITFSMFITHSLPRPLSLFAYINCLLPSPFHTHTYCLLHYFFIKKSYSIHTALVLSQIKHQITITVKRRWRNGTRFAVHIRAIIHISCFQGKGMNYNTTTMSRNEKGRKVVHQLMHLFIHAD